VLKSLNPAFADSFRQTLENLQQSQSLAEDAAVIIYKQVVTDADNQKILQLKRLPNYKAYLYQWLRPFGFTAWEDIYGLADAQSGKYILSEGFRLLKDREHLILEPLQSLDNQPVYTIEEFQTKIDIPFKLILEEVSSTDKNPTKKVIFVDNQLINFPLFLRRWQEGDYFYPAGMMGQKKKVSKYFKDEKFSLADKENTWLLCSGESIVWIVGHRADERFRPKKETNTILKIAVL
jgi:tRNA(Ile)-lysidine synthase